MPSRTWFKTLALALLGTYPGVVWAQLPNPALSQKTASQEVPFKLYDDHVIVVKGTIGPIRNLNIMLDTGKNPSAISREIAEQLHLQGHIESLLFSNGKIQVESVLVPGIDVGAFHLAAAKVLVQDLSFLHQRIGVAIGAVAGLDVLSTRNFMIDYWRRKIVFGPMTAARKSVRFEQQGHFLTVKAQVDGQTVRLLVDSGTSGLLLYQSRLNTRLEPLTASDPALSTAAGSMRAAWFHASRVLLGKVNLGPEPILIADVQPDPSYEFDGLLGFTQLGFQEVWLDFEHGLLGWE
jgi:hypothetical protein